MSAPALLRDWKALEAACRGNNDLMACEKRDSVGQELGQKGWCFNGYGPSRRWVRCQAASIAWGLEQIKNTTKRNPTGAMSQTGPAAARGFARYETAGINARVGRRPWRMYERLKGRGIDAARHAKSQTTLGRETC
jgi:hypothetical protein